MDKRDGFCVWVPVVWPSGRISTMFYETECGKTAALPDNAEYCYLCGHTLDVIERQATRSFVGNVVLGITNGGGSSPSAECDSPK